MKKIVPIAIAFSCSLLASPPRALADDTLAQDHSIAEAHARALGAVADENAIEAKAGSQCTGGIQYDDGTFEDGYGFQTSAFIGTYAMRFRLPAAQNRLNAICLCWRSLGGFSHDFGLRVWDADGTNGGPGTLLKVLPAGSATGVGVAATWVRYEIPGGLDVATDTVYVAPVLAATLYPSRYLCADENGPGGAPGYVGLYSAASNPDIRPTVQLGTAGISPDYKALGIRLEAEASSACIPTATALCLNRGRFKVEANYRTVAGQTGDAQVVKLTDETGYFWFFNATNVESVVKILDGCALNNRFWVFAGGLTDVFVSLTITDTETGLVKTYSNPLATPFQPVQDINAFASCN